MTVKRDIEAHIVAAAKIFRTELVRLVQSLQSENPDLGDFQLSTAGATIQVNGVRKPLTAVADSQEIRFLLMDWASMFVQDSTVIRIGRVE